MIDPTCPKEDIIRKALILGQPSPELRNHLDCCPVCRETAAVVSSLGKVRKASLEEFNTLPRISSAGDILEKARNRRMSLSPESAAVLKPIRIFHRFILPAGLTAVLLAAILNRASLKALLLSLPGLHTLIRGFRGLPAGPGSTALALIGLLAGLGLLTLTVLAAATRGRPDAS